MNIKGLAGFKYLLYRLRAIWGFMPKIKRGVMSLSEFYQLWLIYVFPIGVLCGIISTSLFFKYKRPEYTLNKLSEHSNIYWFQKKILQKVVPEKFVNPIYFTYLVGVFIFSIFFILIIFNVIGAGV